MMILEELVNSLTRPYVSRIIVKDSRYDGLSFKQYLCYLGPNNIEVAFILSSLGCSFLPPDSFFFPG